MQDYQRTNNVQVRLPVSLAPHAFTVSTSSEFAEINVISPALKVAIYDAIKLARLVYRLHAKLVIVWPRVCLRDRCV